MENTFGTVFVDLKNAFHIFDHKVLLKLMSVIGVRGETLQRFKNYITDWKITTKVDNSLSKE